MALNFLLKVLDLEKLNQNNYLSLASTNLNICAIYSYLQKHDIAQQYAKNSIGYAEKVMKKYLKLE